MYVYNEHADPTKIRLKKQEIKLTLIKKTTFFYIKKKLKLFILLQTRQLTLTF